MINAATMKIVESWLSLLHVIQFVFCCVH